MSYALHDAAFPARPAPVVRRLGRLDVVDALRDGLDDFKAIPTQLLFLGLLYPVIGLVAARTATGNLLPLLFPLVAGLSLLGPVLAVGLYELSRRRERGLAVSWLNAFDVARSPGLPGIIALGLVLLVVFGTWLLAARAIYHLTVGTAVPGSIGGFIDMLLHAPGGRSLFLLGNLAGFGFAVVVLAISAVSFPMMLDRACSPVLAVQTSLRVVSRNLGVMAFWGFMVAVLLAAGSLPFFVGLAVVMPILGHATWHLYRRAVG
jgi:uncharacterized membrane protein